MPTPQIRDFATITQGLVQQLNSLVPEITDYVAGGVVRSLLETLAIELQRQDYAMFDAIRQAIETGTYQNFAFSRLPAVPASGFVRLTRQAGLTADTVSTGFRVKVPASSRTYVTTEVATLAIGALEVDIPVRSTSIGTGGNTAAGTILELVDPLGFVATLTNPAPFLNGLDQENETARRQRFLLFIAGLSRGTVVALRFATLSAQLLDIDGVTIERVASAAVREPFFEDPTRRLGLVEVWIDNGSGTSSAALVAETLKILKGFFDDQGTRHEGWVAAGIEVRVNAVVAQVLDVSGSVDVSPGFDGPAVAIAAGDAIRRYLQGLSVFQEAVHAELVAAAMGVPGVTDILLTAPVANIGTGQTTRIVPGTIAISCSV